MIDEDLVTPVIPFVPQSNPDDRRYVIFNISEISLINFDEIHETSPDTMRTSIDGTKGILKYDTPQPHTISLLTSKSVEYNYSEIFNILLGPEWMYTEGPNGY